MNLMVALLDNHLCCPSFPIPGPQHWFGLISRGRRHRNFWECEYGGAAGSHMGPSFAEAVTAMWGVGWEFGDGGWGRVEGVCRGTGGCENRSASHTWRQRASSVGLSPTFLLPSPGFSPTSFPAPGLPALVPRAGPYVSQPSNTQAGSWDKSWGPSSSPFSPGFVTAEERWALGASILGDGLKAVALLVCGSPSDGATG